MHDRDLYLPDSVDTHCHLIPMSTKGLDAEETLRRARDGNMRALVDIGLSPADLDARRKLVAGFEWVSARP